MINSMHSVNICIFNSTVSRELKMKWVVVLFSINRYLHKQMTKEVTQILKKIYVFLRKYIRKPILLKKITI